MLLLYTGILWLCIAYSVAHVLILIFSLLRIDQQQHIKMKLPRVHTMGYF